MQETEFSLGDESTSLGSFNNLDDFINETPFNTNRSATKKEAVGITSLVEKGGNAVMSSILGISTLTAITGVCVLLTIRPAFIMHRGGKDHVDANRVGIWMLIIFAAVAFRDHYSHIYSYAMELKSSVSL